MNDLVPVEGIYNIISDPISGLGALVNVAGGLKDLLFNDDEDINSLVEYNKQLQEQNTVILQEVQEMHQEVAALSVVSVSVVFFAFSFGMFAFFTKLFGKLKLRRG